MAVTPLRSFVVGQSNDLSCTRNNIRCLHWRLSSSVNTHRIVSNRLLLSNWVKARSPIDVLWPVTCAAQSCLTRCLAHGKCDTEMLTVLSILLCMQNRPPCLWAVNLKSPVTRLSVSQIHFNQFSHHFGITHILVVNYAVKNRDCGFLNSDDLASSRFGRRSLILVHYEKVRGWRRPREHNNSLLNQQKSNKNKSIYIFSSVTY